ncbi:hypothetical protein DRQ16_02770 [bacterium]|nr:MAG: hypothetical protein DRQ16_02770 [bacterium]
MILLLISLSHLSQTPEGEPLGSGNLIGFILESPALKGEFVINPAIPPGDSTSFTSLFFYGFSSCARGTRIPSIGIEIPLPLELFGGFYMLQERDFAYSYVLGDTLCFERDTLLQFSRGKGERISFAGFSGWRKGFFSCGVALKYVKLSREDEIYIDMLSSLGRDYADTTRKDSSWLWITPGILLSFPWVDVGMVATVGEEIDWNAGLSLKYRDFSLLFHLTPDETGLGAGFKGFIVGFEKRKDMIEAGTGFLFPVGEHEIFAGYRVIKADEEYIHRIFLGMRFRERW